MSWDAGLWDSAVWNLTESGSSVYYYYKKRLPESIPPVPDGSKIDWGTGAITKAKLDRYAVEALEVDKFLVVDLKRNQKREY